MFAEIQIDRPSRRDTPGRSNVSKTITHLRGSTTASGAGIPQPTMEHQRHTPTQADTRRKSVRRLNHSAMCQIAGSMVFVLLG